uniref:DUF202 domain-containing protein n=1 Tax=Leptospirillum ferrooxidans TaxID=180 RepID=UPI00155DA852|nr:DUF202 domain-containing protein [Leptospirillum ferrooxidans]
MIGVVQNLRKGQDAVNIGFDQSYSLGDHIAFDQFLLAIERNFLLHITTCLNMTVVGLAMFRFFSSHKNDLYAEIGILFFVIAFLIVLKGTRDYIGMLKILRRIPMGLKE